MILFDSIYAHKKTFSGESFIFPFSHYPEGTIITSGLSKTLSAGGKRLGFIYLPSILEPIKKYLTSYMSETISAVDATLQYAACKLYEEKQRQETESYMEHIQKINSLIICYIVKKMKNFGLDVNTPEGAFYVFPSFDNYKNKLKKYNITTSPQLAEFMLNKLSISCLPGNHFGLNPNELSVRIATQDFSGDEALLAAQRGEQFNEQFIRKYAPNIINGIQTLQNFINELIQ